MSQLSSSSGETNIDLGESGNRGVSVNEEYYSTSDLKFRKKRNGPIALNNYNYEWNDEGFFNKPVDDALPSSPWDLRKKLEKYHIMEVAWGVRQGVEISVGELLKKIRGHTWGGAMGRQPRSVPDITYRDLAQILSEVNLVPAFEIRQNCIILCLPPLCCVVLHDRVMIHVNNMIDLDTLLLRLEELTLAYSKKAEETESYFLKYFSDRSLAHGGFIRNQSDNLLFLPPRPMSKEKSMLLTEDLIERSGEYVSSLQAQKRGFARASMNLDDVMLSGNHELLQAIPRFVLFPLEFANLEILISYAFGELNKEVDHLDQEVQKILLDTQKENYTRRLVDRIRDIKLPIHKMLENTSGLASALNSILDNPQDMSMMELTKLFYSGSCASAPIWKRNSVFGGGANQGVDPGIDAGGSTVIVNPNLEILLEFFTQEVGIIQNRVKNIQNDLQSAEKHMMMIINLRRNLFHKWDIACGIAAVGLGLGAVISGTLGMNVPNHQEENERAFFYYVTAISVPAIMSFCMAYKIAFRNAL